MNILQIFVLEIGIALACSGNCLTCWGEGSNECLLCYSHYLWENGVCSLIHERDIVGFGRECVECKQYNYVTKTFTCAPCPYPARTCDSNRDYECKSEKGFELGNDNKCECVKGIFYQGRCICQEENTYPDGNGGCEACITKFQHLPYCQNFTCPSHTYDNGEKCIECHYSCQECDGPKEENCLSCNKNFEFVSVLENNVCLCNCLMIETNEECICNDHTLNCLNLIVEIPIDEVNITTGEHPCNAGYQLFQGQCILCIYPKIVNTQGVCVCPENKADFNGICLPQCLDPNEHRINETTCICNTNFEKYNGVCTPLCLENQVRDSQGACVCVLNFQLLGTECLPCREGKYFDSLGECICPSDTIEWNNKCLAKCKSSNIHYNDNNECECNNGYELINEKCVEKCMDNAERVAEVCQCKNGYTFLNNKCLLNCESDMHFNNNGECICNDGYEKVETNCLKQCKEHQKRHPKFHSCDCIDDYDYVKEDDTCKPKCNKDGFEERNNKLNCDCMMGYKRFHGRCKIKCTGLKDFDEEGKCVCPSDLVEHNNNCVKPCVGSHQHLADDDSCACDQNYEKFNNDCYINCNEFHKRNSKGVCDCIEGYTKFSEKCKANCNSEREFDLEGNCNCKNNYVDHNGKCYASCVENAHYNSNMGCDCDTGFTLSSKKCISICSTNEEYSMKTNKCQCKEGYALDKKGKCSLK